jgi:hypothetical protein
MVSTGLAKTELGGGANVACRRQLKNLCNASIAVAKLTLWVRSDIRTAKNSAAKLSKTRANEAREKAAKASQTSASAA